MAGIIYNAGNAAILNPTSEFIPVRINNQFLDSSLYQDGDYQSATYLNTVDNTNLPYGLIIEPQNYQTMLGDFNGNISQTYIQIKSDALLPGIVIDGKIGVEINANDPAQGTVFINATDQIRFTSKQFRFQGTNITQPTSGGNAGAHLKVNVNGTSYVIRLELP